MITRKMEVESRTERKGETIIELRRRNSPSNADDRMTLVVIDEGSPSWHVSQIVTVTVEAE